MVQRSNKETDMPLLRIAPAAVATLLAAGAAPAMAQTPEQFYAGKTIELVIGYPPAGSNDVYGRLLARHLGKHIPGHPGIVPKNTPGAGSFLALAQIYNLAPKDGTVIGIGAPTAPLDEKLGTQGVRFKTAEFNWIGRIDSLINIVFMWKTSPVKTVADAQRLEAKLAGTGAGSTVSIYPTVMNNVLGTKFKLVMGYRGSNEAQLAVERGEVDGHSTSWTAVKVAHPDWWPSKSISILVQFALSSHPELKGVPVIVDLARNDEERAILRAVMNATEIGTAFFTTPGVPADRVAALRRAFDATMKDPDFLAEAEKTHLTVGPLAGEALQKLVTEVSDLSPALLEKVRTAYGTKPH
jgi:tripartite-type tricarboxylate transporter receptor subunit TctC